ncbi:Protein of unknown function [Haloechinothrix alba]|uniref:DUF2516 family protein n=1 Tax=Haloechinothrix alba TaxID=664784 RepID=A0A238W200_9PSEU|nr:Protein of unknown function [Haloechinothrix alba]
MGSPYAIRVPGIDTLIIYAINLAGIPLGIFAFVHALMQRADAYTAANRMTKPAWLGITGAAGFVLVLPVFSFYGPGTLFWLASLVAVLVYIVDVRPSLAEVQGKG